MTAPKQAAPKMCPRCGAFYNILASQTCPQCFGYLRTLEADEAAQYLAEQEARVNDPSILAQKEEEDEKYRHQAFQACLGVIAISIVTVVIAVILISFAAHHHKIAVPVTSGGEPGYTGNAPGIGLLPTVIGDAQKISVATVGHLPGSTANIDVANYTRGIIIVVVNKSPLTTEQAQALELTVNAIAIQHVPQLAREEFDIDHTHFSVLGPTEFVVHQVLDTLKQKETI